LYCHQNLKNVESFNSAFISGCQRNLLSRYIKARLLPLLRVFKIHLKYRKNFMLCSQMLLRQHSYRMPWESNPTCRHLSNKPSSPISQHTNLLYSVSGIPTAPLRFWLITPYR
jgi:hypothetical protein